MSWWIIVLLILGFPIWTCVTVFLAVCSFYTCRELHLKELNKINNAFSKENLKIQKEAVSTLATLMDNLKTMRENENESESKAQSTKSTKPIIN